MQRVFAFLGLVSGLCLAISGAAHAQTQRLYSGSFTPELDTVVRSDLDGGNLQPVIPGPAFSLYYDIEVDLVGGRIYAAHDFGPQRIISTDLSGGDLDVLISSATDFYISLALDTVNGKLYYVNNQLGDVRRMNLDGTGDELVHDFGTGAQRDVDVDPVAGFIYFGDANVGGTATSSGLFRMSIADINNGLPNTATQIVSGLPFNRLQNHIVDPATQKIYWTETSPSNLLRRADANGGLNSNVETVVDSGINIPGDVELDFAGGRVYWNNRGDDQIKRADLPPVPNPTSLKNLNVANAVARNTVALEVVNGSAAVCGNGIPESGEECDDGAGNSDTDPDACRTTCLLPFCGDDVQDTGEGCDDGAGNSDTDPDACRTTCVAATCGDDVQDTGEQCDDGPSNSDTTPNACRTNCLLAFCGDDVQDTGEQCDDGLSNSDTTADACRTTCLDAFCGDDVQDTGEACDDGLGNSDTAPDACRTICALASCGDDVQDTGEACDDGILNSDTNPDACRTTCVDASCGDDVQDTGEACDDGVLNSDTNPDACRTSCVDASCGDDVQDTGEACDDGAGNSDTNPDACRTTCVDPSCGDDVQDTGEGCDDGVLNSDTNPDACRTTCVDASCGDDVQDTGEACDDGVDNSDSAADACRTTCAAASCGDGVQDSGETCDDGAANSNTLPDACRTTCAVATCGDGIVDDGEDCDNGPDNSNTARDGCRTTCALAFCGDGVRDTDEECDDGDENTDEAPNGCRTGCAAASCGDGVLDDGEICDDGDGNSDTVPGACRSSCSFDGIEARGSGGCAAGGPSNLAGVLLVLGLLLLRRRRSSAAAAVALALAIPGAATAQELDGFRINRHAAPMSIQDGLALQRPDTLGHLGLSLQLTLDYSDAPLIVSAVGDEDDSVEVVGPRLGADIGLALGLGSRFQVGAVVPVTLDQAVSGGTVAGMNIEEPGSSGLGDPQIIALARILGARDGARLGLLGAIVLPVGEQDDFMGDGGVGARGGVLGAVPIGAVELVGNAEVGYRPSREFVDAELGTELGLRGGIHWTAHPAVRVMGELASATTVEDVASRTSPIEALVGARFRIGGGFFASAGGGVGLNDAVGNPGFRLLASVGWGQIDDGDADGDGIADGRDRCRDQAEDLDQIADDDGCPDMDDDGDGVADTQDRCRNKPETVNDHLDDDGCPDTPPDADGDGIVDAKDSCQLKPETRNGHEDHDGCPDTEPDADADGLVDANDKCPTEAETANGFEDTDGCPDQPPRVLTLAEVEGQIPPPIEFEQGSAVLKESSAPALDAVAELMKSHTQIKRLMVRGHTSAEGTAAFNLQLSQDRAQAVVQALVARGIDAGRLDSEGVGKTKPIASNRTASGRKANRRVEFLIVTWE